MKLPPLVPCSPPSPLKLSLLLFINKALTIILTTLRLCHHRLLASSLGCFADLGAMHEVRLWGGVCVCVCVVLGCRECVGEWSCLGVGVTCNKPYFYLKEKGQNEEPLFHDPSRPTFIW